MRRIAVVGLGYVGLPVARAFARAFPGTVGFDRDGERVEGLRRGVDPTGALAEAGSIAGLTLSGDAAVLADRDFFVVAVPTPIDASRRPDLSALEEAAVTIARSLNGRGRSPSTMRPRPIVVLESTGHPGLTEQFFGPLLERESGLVRGRDFRLGYSPERINPGDPEHRFERVRKVIAAEDEETLDVLEDCYARVVEAGVHRAPSIAVAEAAKVIENVQRDLNVALVNELAQICDRLGIDTHEVLETAGTKWNFLPFRPGLVGGHCIGVDPYYLAEKAVELGVEPRVILAGRAVNDGMAAFVAERTLALLERTLGAARGARVAVLGLSFKPDVADLRNSRVPEVIARLAAAGVEVRVHDPRCDRELAARLYGIELVGSDELGDPGAVLLAQPHRGLPDLALELARERGKASPVRLLVSLHGGLEPRSVPPGVVFWRL